MAQIPIKTSRYWPHHPHVKQGAFLSLPHKEAMYGGAAGGGKSDALLMAALQWVEVPTYSALLLRRTFPDLNQPGGLIPLSKEWLAGTGVKWNDNEHRWTFPSGATITFGYLQHEDDKLRYQGAAYQFIGFDELTQFSETQYKYLFSRIRKLEQSPVPLRMRSASNPGGPGHDWVKERFITDGVSSRVFIPARLADNPSLDQDAYLESLAELDHHTRKQLLEGDWDARPPGDLFRRGWFTKVQSAPECVSWVRYWDLAATEPSEANKDPDWTVGLRMGRTKDGVYVVEHIKRDRRRPDGVKKMARQMADRDGVGTKIKLEQEPGSSGKTVVDQWQRDLPDRTVKGNRSTGKKWDRASVVSSKAEAGQIQIVEADWNSKFLDELEAFTEDDQHAHDDQVDALSGAYEELAGRGVIEARKGIW
jgi:predicted phage terminase large subunit-like protein